MTGLTWRIGAFILAGLLAVVGGAGLYDAIDSRATIRTLIAEKNALVGIVQSANQNVGSCHASMAGLDARLTEQNADIRDLGKETKKLADDSRLAMKGLEAQGKGVQAEVRRIGSLPQPAPAESCSAAERVLRGQL